ncbi:prolyl 4-hydroxylase [Sphingomonas sp. PP-F2F-G114-C0414]|uniref:2OG-Fe(II) oxygenase n=1 Tax=Sphingomonas sp. PP-F2F-G114-C0414 TaxID=2135662 RepID=UPI000EF95F18|nr:2OG-Fe(II) oxygenase [Sphingomonas sp. PP-F2F-G114-C0414]RMB34277.1 prolyl 4-hydroxylase [Sphingomonas sp. PP-F2F-G114-C0414]
MTEDPVARADQLLREGHAREAVDLILEASASGHADALFRNAMWKLAGEPIARDLPGARALLRRASTQGNADATLVEIALTANGSGAPNDWPGALALLESIADHHTVAAEHRALLRRMTLTIDGGPAHIPTAEKIGKHPCVQYIPRLFTQEECLHVAYSAADLLEPAMVADPRTGASIPNAVRTSDSAVIGPTRETLVIQALNRRVAAVSNTDWRQGEALSVLRYRPGQQFRPHIDALPATRNQRIRTVLIYLNDGFSGGATYFVHNALRVTPRMGDAIIFDNVRADGSIDPTTRHAGEPVTNGVKWLATRWIRARPFSVWNGPESAADDVRSTIS